MNARPSLSAVVLVLVLVVGLVHDARAADDYIDRLEEFTTFSAFGGAFRVRLSGTMDLEYYHLQQPAPGLLYTKDDDLFNPRLSLFLDAQIGSKLYAFVQARVDRGFDPHDGGARARFDEYALRYTPWDDGRLNVQIGKFATVAGNYGARHLSWDNPFITAPLPYENLTGIWDVAGADSTSTLLFWGHVPSDGISNFGNGYLDKPMRVPIVWGPSYTTGLSIAGRLGKFDYAAEIKNAALSSNPEYWDLSERNFDHPTFTGRLGFRPNEMWNFGVSASTGGYLSDDAATTVAPGHSLGDYQEQILAQDLSFEWHHVQLWAECYEARFRIPTVGDADTVSYYLEAKYKVTPQLFAALRWNQQLYGTLPDNGIDVQWGNDLWRIDAALGYRFTPHTQLKLQYSLQHEQNAAHDLTNLIAGQFTLRF